MEEDIMQAIESAAQNALENLEQMEKEALINKVALDTATDFGHALYNVVLILTPAMRPQMEMWIAQNRHRLSLQMGQVVRIMLRKELFTE